MELPFLLHTGDTGGLVTAVRGTIDLLLLWEDESPLVVDYKSGHLATGERLAGHLKQLLAYAAAVIVLVEPSPAVVRCQLVYTGGAVARSVAVSYDGDDVAAWRRRAGETILEGLT